MQRSRARAKRGVNGEVKQGSQHLSVRFGGGKRHRLPAGCSSRYNALAMGHTMRRISLCLLTPLLFVGCEKIYLEHAENQERLAASRVTTGDYAGAITAYEAALNGQPESAMTHYHLGVIYEEHLDDPVSAMHHFQRYLVLAPEGSRRKDVENYIKEDQLKLITRSGHGAILPQREAVRLKNENMELRQQVLKLRADLDQASKERAAMLRSMGREAGKKFGGEQVKKPLVPGVRTYTVAKGDTLASIARRFYNNSANWKRIQDANFAPMDRPATLQIGMELMIP